MEKSQPKALLSEDCSWTESQGMMLEPGSGVWQENALPESAAQVFSPTSKNTEAFWEREEERRPFLEQRFYQEEWPEDASPKGRCCSDRLGLKMTVSLGTSALLFPFLVWGGYVFLQFNAPLMDGAPLRLVYTLRCSVFATVPILLGYLVLGVVRMRSGDVRSQCETEGVRHSDVSIHQSFVCDSAHLFLLYFLQLVVMAMYLSQDQLKLVPLLTVVFCLGRLVYWVAASFQSSIRAFGFGLSFLPSLAMMAANLYFMVTMETTSSILSQHRTSEQAPPAGQQRFWE